MNLTQKVILVDLEGTLTNCAHRIHHLNARDYDAWNKGLHLDPPNEVIIELVSMLECFYTIIITTAKPDKYINDIKAWLNQHTNFEAGLVTRDNKNMDTSPVLKQIMVHDFRKQGFEIQLAIDDRPDVCDMYRRENIPTLRVMT